MWERPCLKWRFTTARCTWPVRSPKIPTQDISGQTREVLGHIDRLLDEAGSDKILHPDVPDFHR